MALRIRSPCPAARITAWGPSPMYPEYTGSLRTGSRPVSYDGCDAVDDPRPRRTDQRRRLRWLGTGPPARPRARRLAPQLVVGGAGARRTAPCLCARPPRVRPLAPGRTAVVDRGQCRPPDPGDREAVGRPDRAHGPLDGWAALDRSRRAPSHPRRVSRPGRSRSAGAERPAAQAGSGVAGVPGDSVHAPVGGATPRARGCGTGTGEPRLRKAAALQLGPDPHRAGGDRCAHRARGGAPRSAGVAGLLLFGCSLAGRRPGAEAPGAALGARGGRADAPAPG